MKKSSLFFIPFLLTAAGCHSMPSIPPAVSGFEIERYLGRWYEIARLPNWFEQGMSDISAEYSRLPDGSLLVVNRGIKSGKAKSISGKLRFAGRENSGELEVSFFRPFYNSYRIIKLAPDYRYSVVTSGNGKYLWILSRDRTLPESDFNEITAFLERHAFPIEKLIWDPAAASSPQQTQ